MAGLVDQTKISNESKNDVLRVTIGNLRTTREHVRKAWELIREAHAKLAGT